jgi:inhibitor of cysteine peptidase
MATKNDDRKVTNMKKALLLVLLSILLLPLILAGCKKTEAEIIAPADNSGAKARIVEVILDEFTAQNNMVKDVELTSPDSLVVKLGANPTTGYDWEEAVISNTGVMTQASRDYIGPTDTNVVGAGGTDAWTFESKAAGTTTIKFSYSRPWEGGEKGIYTLTINVTVK